MVICFYSLNINDIRQNTLNQLTPEGSSWQNCRIALFSVEVLQSIWASLLFFHIVLLWYVLAHSIHHAYFSDSFLCFLLTMCITLHHHGCYWWEHWFTRTSQWRPADFLPGEKCYSGDEERNQTNRHKHKTCLQSHSYHRGQLGKRNKKLNESL